jgi:hypothetical protein
MERLELLPPVMRGTWLYAGRVPCEVRIVRHRTLYGSGDHEDEPSISEDREVECFYVLYQTPVGLPQWVGGGVAPHLIEAVSIAEEKLSGGVAWE